MGPSITFLSVVAVVALMALGIGYAIYFFSSAKRWRDAMLELNSEAKQRRRREERELVALDEQLTEDLRAASERHFRDMLRRIDIEELKAYPGIGDVMIERLRSAGVRSLADLQYELPEIAGIGEKRLSDIRHATRDLGQQAHKVYTSNMCAEAAAAADEALHLKQKREAAARASQECMLSLDQYVNSIAPLVAQARQITLFRYLRSLLERDSDFDAGLPPIPPRWSPTAHVDKAQPARIMAARRTWEPAVASNAPPAPKQHRQQTVPVAAVPGPSVGILVSAQPSLARAPIPEKVAQVGERVMDSAHSAPPRAMPPTTQSEPRHILLMELSIQFLFAAARCDGHIARKEREIIDEQIRRQYAHDPILFNRARSYCAQYESEAIDLDNCFRKIAEMFSPPHRSLLMQLATQIAEASRGINTREEAFLEKAAQGLGVPRPTAAPSVESPHVKIVKGSESAPPSELRVATDHKPSADASLAARSALELDPQAALSVELVRRQYNLLIERFDEGKMNAMGPEFVAIGTAKRSAFANAAKALLVSLGAEPDLAPPSPPAPGLRDNPDLDQIFGA
jgi:uncharacterized tellurite resistance protein B-like protein